MQCACAILSTVPCPALQYFFTNLINGTTFGKKKLLSIKCVFFLYNFCTKHFSFYEEFGDRN
jgi:hypothetical protein